MNKDFEVIIVGGGGSGLAAAVSAAENGLRVLVLEKQSQLGGTTGIAVGSFTANRTSSQQQAGVSDSVDEHEEDAGKFAPSEIEARNDSQLRRFFLSHTAETLAWLTDKGLIFFGPNPEPPNRVPRMHNVVPAAKAYIATLQANLLRLGGEIRCDAPVIELLKSEGRVVGVRAEIEGQPIELNASRGVVLAAGDYANSPSVIGEYKGNDFSAIEGINPHATGDGHLLAKASGARLINMDVAYGPELRFIPPAGKTFHQLLPSGGLGAKILGRLLPLVPQAVMNWMIKRLLVTWQHPENSLFEDGAILVNQRGERFCNEKVWPDREISIAAQPNKIAFLLLDQRLCARYSAWPHFISTAPEIAYAYVNDYLKLRPDVACGANDLKSLAAQPGLSGAALASVVDTFNRYASGEQADLFGRTGDEHPLEGDQWVLLGPVKAYFTTTEGGAAINQSLQVLDEKNFPIPGLYAVGQNGLGGQVLWGHGLHIAWALTSGRLVGKILSQENPVSLTIPASESVSA